MRQVFLATAILLVIATLLPHATSAEIVQGDAESNTSVTTTIQGSGTVHTHIESTVNGQTKTLDSNQQGTYTLHNSSSTDTQANSNTETNLSPTHTPTATPTATMTPKGKKVDPIIPNILQNLQNAFHLTIQKILSFFHM